MRSSRPTRQEPKLSIATSLTWQIRPLLTSVAFNGSILCRALIRSRHLRDKTGCRSSATWHARARANVVTLHAALSSWESPGERWITIALCFVASLSSDGERPQHAVPRAVALACDEPTRTRPLGAPRSPCAAGAPRPSCAGED